MTDNSEDELRQRRTDAHRKWVKANREKVNEYKRGAGKANPETVKRWRLSNPEKTREYKKNYYLKNKNSILEKSKLWVKNNKETYAKYKKEYAERNREAIRQRQKARVAADPEAAGIRRWEYQKRRRANFAFRGARRSARDKGVEFNLTVAWFQQRLDLGACEMSGIQFDMEAKRGPLSPSVDRINPSGPYTQANCRLILWYLNKALTNLGEDFAMHVFGEVFKKKFGSVPN